MEQELLIKLLDAMDAETKANTETVVNYLKGLTDKNIKVGVSLTDGYYITVQFNDENDNYIFGANCTITYSRIFDFKTHEYNDPELAMDCCSTGTCTRKENPGRPWLFKFMSNLWDKEEEFTNLLDSLPHSARDNALQAQREYDKEIAHKEYIEDQAKEAEIRSKLVIGYTFDNHDDSYEVTKVTPKRIYVKQTETTSRKNYQTDENHHYIGYIPTKVTEVTTGFFDINTIVNILKRDLSYSHLNLLLKGNHYISRTVEPSGELVHEGLKF